MQSIVNRVSTRSIEDTAWNLVLNTSKIVNNDTVEYSGCKLKVKCLTFADDLGISINNNEESK